MTNRREQFEHLVSNLKDIPKENLIKEKNSVKKSPYRQRIHIESLFGMLGDPNGFSYFNGYYHLFHQWFPMKYSTNPNYFQQGWFYWKSRNLVDWIPVGEAMNNDTVFDKYGVYSGSAIPINNKLFLMYNGNSWTNTDTDDWHRVPCQLGAYMNENDNVAKLANPLIKGPISGYTSHFRDPKIFKKNGKYYSIIGAQTKAKTGTVLIYESQNLRIWNKVGEVKTNFEKTGYMWECPDYFELDNKGILLFCPQGLKSKGSQFLNTFQACYAIGNKLDFRNLYFEGKKFEEIDSGFDFYAPQTMIEPDGRRILSAWMSIMNSNSPLIKYHYDGCLIFPRELSVQNDKLIQKPVSEIKKLYTTDYKGKRAISKNQEIVAGLVNCRDIKFDISTKDNSAISIIDLFANRENTSHLRLVLNRMKNRFIVQRGKAGIEFEDEFGNERSCELKVANSVSIRIIQDISSAEIFINNGENVFTMRVFVPKDQYHIFVKNVNGEVNVKYQIHQLRKMSSE